MYTQKIKPKNMKKIALYFATTCLVFPTFFVQANTLPTNISTTHAEQAEKLQTRLTNINRLSKTNLNAKDKKQLRVEVINIQKQLKQLDGGLYLSVGTIIIILLLLILLL
jgi:predicted PurR-regulated permease PerM